MKKRHIALLIVLVTLAFGVAFPFLQTAHQMKQYLKVVNLILSRLVDTFSSRILYPMLLLSGNHSIAVV